MRIDIASRPAAPGHPNEDFAAVALPAGPDGGFALVLDGVSAPADRALGCRHGTPWFVARIGGAMTELALRGDPLPACLAEAVSRTAAAHAADCDLLHRRTPQATLAAARWDADQVEYLVLGDSELLAGTPDGSFTAVLDRRVEQVRSRPEMREWQRHLARLPMESPEFRRAMQDYQRFADGFRNAPDGFHTVAADPAVAARALHGSLPRAAAGTLALLTDGVTQWSTTFGRGSRADLLALLAREGCGRTIDRVRDLERADPQAAEHPRRKAHDDASAVFLELSADSP